MASIAFGIFDHLDRRPLLAAQIYEERLQLLEAADAAGFYGYHLAEHHATPLSLAPSPGIFLAAASQRTRRIRLGALVYLLPLYNPLRLLEEICMLDHLSKGRLDLGVGRGASPFELGFFGVDSTRSREMFEEALGILLQGFQGEQLLHKGEYYRYPNVPLELQPLQKPYPPIWYPTSRRESVPFVARNGLNTMFSGAPESVRGNIAIYREVWQQHRDAPGRLNAHVAEPKIGINLKVYVAETDEEALAVARPAQREHYANLVKLWQDFNTTPTGFTPDLDLLMRNHAALVGSPKHVREQAAYALDISGANYLVGQFHFGAMTHEQALRSLGLFAGEVMPVLLG
ncbi:MAG: LLM class flavin-dependent oxidoreductase [Dehalococcoidia bacterium]